MREYTDEILADVKNIEMQILKDFIDLCDRHNLEYFGFAGTGIGVLRHQGFIPWDDDIDVGLPRKDYELFLKYAKEELGDKYTVMNCEEDSNYPLMTTRLMKKGTVFREYALKNINCELGIFLDIYAFDNLSDNEKEAKKQMRDAWLYSKLLILRSIPFPVLGVRGWKKVVVHMACGCAHLILKCARISKQKIYRKCKEACCRYNDILTQRVDYLADTTPDMNIFYKNELYPLKKMKFEDIEMNFPNDMHRTLTKMYGDYMQLPPKEKRKNHFPYELRY